MRLNDPWELKAALDAAAEAAGRIVLLTHRNPDGDGFAACLAFREILRLRGKNADIVLEQPIADYYDFLEGRIRSNAFADDPPYDLAVVLDCHERKRLGICAPLADSASRVIVADHHEEILPIDGADVYIDASKASIGVVVFEMYESEIAAMPFSSRIYILNALYTTLLNDTDNFANLNTDSAVFVIAARMCALGLISSIPVREFIFRKTVPEIMFLSEVFASADYHDDLLFVVSTRGTFRPAR
jgi:bifunctional oligoribonuclease and PAP phosphatase NrnA